MFRSKLQLFLGALIILAVGGCNLNTPNDQPTTVSGIAILHAAPDGPNLNVIVDGNLANTTAFAYASYSSYIPFPPGTKAMKLTSAADLSAITDSTMTFFDNKYYTLFVVNKLPSIKWLAVEDVGTIQTTGHSMVRTVHLAPETGAVNVTLVGQPSLSTNQVYKQISIFKEIDNNLYTIEVRASSDNHLIATAPFQTQPGGFYSIVLMGLENPPSGNTHTLTIKIL